MTFAWTLAAQASSGWQRTNQGDSTADRCGSHGDHGPLRASDVGRPGGQPGSPHRYTVNPGTADERVLVRGKFDKEPLSAGDLLRVETAAGGGWGDPLERDVSECDSTSCGALSRSRRRARRTE